MVKSMNNFLEHFDLPAIPHGAVVFGDIIGIVQTGQGSFSPREMGGSVWSFQVPDNRLGIKAVAAALGNGMPNIPEGNVSSVYRELGLFRDKAGFAHFRQPVILCSRDTIGFRAIWGGVRNSYYKEFEGEDGCNIVACRLRTNLLDGGILVQSSSSAAYITAEKRGYTWTLTLNMPMAKDGTLYGHKYRSAFRGAQRWYNRERQRQDQPQSQPNN